MIYVKILLKVISTIIIVAMSITNNDHIINCDNDNDIGNTGNGCDNRCVSKNGICDNHDNYNHIDKDDSVGGNNSYNYNYDGIANNLFL